MSLAVVFSGQGTQHPSMLPWLADDDLVARAGDMLGVKDWRAHLADAHWAANNTSAQVLLTGLGLAAWQQLAPSLPQPAAMAGYSVGELAAFCAAGVYDAATALALARERAAAMDRCAALEPGGLLSMSGLTESEVAQLCAHSGTSLAIRSGSNAVVLGGPHAALDAAAHTARARGAKCTRLKVQLASHTPCMKPASLAFAQCLSGVPLRAPSLALFSNAADRVTTAAQAAHALSLQIAQTVRWDLCMDNLHARRIDCVLEVGPGASLARMWTLRYPEVPARSVDEFRSVSSIVEWVLRVSGE